MKPWFGSMFLGIVLFGVGLIQPPVEETQAQPKQSIIVIPAPKPTIEDLKKQLDEIKKNLDAMQHPKVIPPLVLPQLETYHYNVAAFPVYNGREDVNTYCKSMSTWMNLQYAAGWDYVGQAATPGCYIFRARKPGQ